MVWAPALESHQTRSSTTFFHSLHISKSRSRKFPPSRVGCPEWNHTLQLHLADLRLGLQRWIRISAPSLNACAGWKQVLPLPQMFPAQQDLGPHSNRLMEKIQITLMKLRSDYRAAVIMKNRLHRESGEPIEENIHPGQQRRIRRGQEFFSEDYLSSARIDQHTGWQYWPSTSSSSWWHASEWSWK